MSKDIRLHSLNLFDTMYCFQLVSDLMLAGMQMLQPLRGFQQMASCLLTVCSSLQHVLYLISVNPVGRAIRRPSKHEAASKGEDASPPDLFQSRCQCKNMETLLSTGFKFALAHEARGMGCFTLEDLESVEFTWTIIDGQLLVACLQMAASVLLLLF